MIPVVGLAGGIGSGKSALARAMARRSRGVVINGDAIGHAALRDPALRGQILQRFGQEVLDAQGQVDRTQLGALAFESDKSIADLESIVHPWILERIHSEIVEARSRPDTGCIIVDAPVLLEAGWSTICDTMIFVDVPLETRLARVLSTRNWSEEQFHQRESRQWPVEKKRDACSFIIDNSNSLELALEQWTGIFRKLSAPDSVSNHPNSR